MGMTLKISEGQAPLHTCASLLACQAEATDMCIAERWAAGMQSLSYRFINCSAGWCECHAADADMRAAGMQGRSY